MKKIIMFLFILQSSIARANEVCGPRPSVSPKVSPSPTPQCQVKPKPQAKPRPIITPAPIIVKPSPTPTPIVVKQDPCCESKGVKNTNVNTNQATTGNQTVIINVPPKQRPRVLIKETTKIQKVRHYVYTPNRIQLLLGLSKNKLDVIQKDCCDLSARNLYQPDIGLQYLRDFGPMTGSILGTVYGNVYLGIGFNW